MSHRSLLLAALLAGAAIGAAAQEAASPATPQAAPAEAAAGPQPGAPFIAGTTPSQRPAGAPVLTEFVKNRAWYDHALFGVSQPYPASLRFLDDEGAWFTPFNRPGMTGPYDIRGWHKTP